MRDSGGRPVPDTLVEIWQTNAAGRYRHSREHHPAPLDPNFDGVGRAITDSGGRYRFITIQPGSYPWGNHYNAWRPAHIHFSLFGRAFTQRLVTQMYFPGDPLLPYDPIYNSVTDEAARQRMIAEFSMDDTQPEWALAFRFDIVLRGRASPSSRSPTHERAAHPVADRRPVLLDAAALAGGPLRGPGGHAGRGHGLRPPVRRGRRPDPRRPHRDLAGRPGRDGSRTPMTRAARSPTATRRSAASAAAATGHDGTYKIVTLKPGALPFGDGRTEAPHIDVSVFSRGMLDRSVTRIYFPDEAAANEADPVLQAVPAERRATLIAVPAGENLLRFDIYMQGEGETVFFDL